jgi:WD40 repeat protein
MLVKTRERASTTEVDFSSTNVATNQTISDGNVYRQSQISAFNRFSTGVHAMTKSMNRPTAFGRPVTLARGIVALLLIATVPTNAARAADEPTIGTYRTWVTALAWSPDSGTLATVGGQSLLYRPGEVRLWDPTSGKLKATLDGHETAVWSVAFSPDGKTLATGGYDGQVKLWNTADGKLKASFEPHKHWVHAVAFSPDGKLLATGSEDATVKLWDISTTPPAEKQTLKGHTAGITSVVFNGNDRIISGSVDRTAILWSVADGQQKGKYEGHTDAVLNVALVDGKTLATSGADRLVKLWTLDEAKAVEQAKAAVAQAAAAAEAAKKAEEAKKEAEKKAAEAAKAPKKEEAKKDEAKKEEPKKEEKKEEPKEPAAPKSLLELASIEAHKNWVEGLDVSRDGKWLVSASHDRSAKLWDVATRKEVAALTGFTGSVWCAGISPDGKSLAVGSHSDSLRLWNLGDRSERFPAKKP